jgi:hypothetical protein
MQRTLRPVCSGNNFIIAVTVLYPASAVIVVGCAFHFTASSTRRSRCSSMIPGALLQLAARAALRNQSLPDNGLAPRTDDAEPEAANRYVPRTTTHPCFAAHSLRPGRSDGEPADWPQQPHYHAECLCSPIRRLQTSAQRRWWRMQWREISASENVSDIASVGGKWPHSRISYVLWNRPRTANLY